LMSHLLTFTNRDTHISETHLRQPHTPEPTMQSRQRRHALRHYDSQSQLNRLTARQPPSATPLASWPHYVAELHRLPEPRHIALYSQPAIEQAITLITTGTYSRIRLVRILAEYFHLIDRPDRDIAISPPIRHRPMMHRPRH
jgi:hypothetical protein